METKGLEPSTSALRTQETLVLSGNLSDVTGDALDVSSSVSPTHDKTCHETQAGAADPGDLLTAMLMIERLPLSDADKAEAVRRLLNTRG